MDPRLADLPKLLRWVWHLVRLPLVALLVILEPIVSLVCGGLALLGVLMTVFFKLVAAPHFPMGMMFSISLGFAVLFVLYEGTIRVLSR